jgi:hypothetical protein
MLAALAVSAALLAACAAPSTRVSPSAPPSAPHPVEVDAPAASISLPSAPSLVEFPLPESEVTVWIFQVFMPTMLGPIQAVDSIGYATPDVCQAARAGAHEVITFEASTLRVGHCEEKRIPVTTRLPEPHAFAP